MSLSIVNPIKQRLKSLPLAVIRGGKRDGHLLVYEDTAAAPGMETSMITLDDPVEVFELIPETRQGMRSVYHICAPSGAGKSTLAAGFARNFQNLFPTGKIVIISSVDLEDPAFDGVDHVRLAADEELNQISMPELAAASGDDSTLLIFDDIEGLPKEKKKALENFQQRALETGRKLNIHVLSLFHRAASGGSTRTSLGECNGLAFFPKANCGNLSYTLKQHFNINPSIKRLLKQPEWGRWVLCRTDGCPAYLLGEKRCALYDSDEVEEDLRCAFMEEKAANTRAARILRESKPMDIW
jgi:hypothetical protein